MEIKVVWTEEATNSHEEIFLFLIEIWNIKIAKAFVQLVDEKIKWICEYPNSALLHDKLNLIQKVIIHPHVTLFYRYLKQENSIEILLFWDNRQDDRKLQF